MSYQMTAEKCLMPEEIPQLLTTIKRLSERDQVLIEVALATGARESELLNIRARDLVASTNSVQIYGLKGSRDRLLPLKPELFARLQAVCKGGERPFDISAQRVRFIWGKIRPWPKKFHSLRHTFAIELYRRTKDIYLVKAALGHKSLNNTMIYLEWLNQTQDLQRIL